uniref:Calpain catalytic domain-containing protein n=1 Tax=Sphaeramia orbicularis TaxID=375764 RepID=A0A673BSV4_9TELE
MPGTCTSIINMRYQDGSEGSASNPAKFNNQDYEQLRDYHVRRQKLFVDSSFPPDSVSLGRLEALSGGMDRLVQWRRPKNAAPVFSSAGTSRFDFGQGSVGNCWFLAAISSLTMHKKLMGQVVPMNQSFDNYAGIFHFRFWRYGKWVDVVIDDFLPTIGDQFISVHAKGGNEFWVPLLEKAYAKVCGSYADMNAGLTTEACKDLSGGVPMSYQLHQVHDANHDEELWRSLSNATGCNSLICCGTASKDVGATHTGLVDAHAYSVTGVAEVQMLVRVLNPWGKQEWNGKWSDGSSLWNEVSREDRDKCVKRNDGEFWIELEDFCHYFNMLSLCCENPNFLDGDVTCQWKCMIYDGSWVAGSTSGGNLFRNTFYKNPQYRIQVSNINKTEVEDKNVLISLMQKGQHQNRKSAKNYPIGMTIFKTKQGRLRSYFFRSNRPIKQGQQYTYERELIEQHSLQPGEYVIIPSTSESHMSTDFVLSVYTKADAKIM